MSDFRASSPSFPRTIAAIEQGIEKGDHLGAQVSIWRDGQPLADLAIGQVRPGEAMRPDHLHCWMSAGKPITAVAIAQLIERGKLQLDDRIASFIPEFAAGGKQDITLRHLLTHTGGFRPVSNNWTPGPWERIIERVCATPLEPGWIIGETAGYHVASSWFILAEIIQRLTDRPFDQYVRAELLEPLGMIDTWIGMPHEQFLAYGGFDGRIAPMFSTEVPPPAIKGMANTEAGCTVFRPGANTRGPIRDLARFYQMLLNGGQLNYHRMLSESMVRQMTSRQREKKLDLTFKRVIDWGFGFIVNSARYGDDGLPYGFGPHASDNTFGHGGNQSSCGLADPKHRIVAAWVCNGLPGELRHNFRVKAINAAIYEDFNCG
ncbi:MAG: beta-lactamase family protein [Phycisphaerae bacterium]|nr:beta-lactamase family protein [Phycisphaerae bacterium]